MKKILIFDEKINRVATEESLLPITDIQAKEIRDAILRNELSQIAQGDLSLISKGCRTAWICSSSSIMSTNCYSHLMQYYYNEHAFSEKEITSYKIEVVGSVTEKDLFFIADELLCMKTQEILSKIKSILLTQYGEINEKIAIMSVHWAFLKEIEG